MRTMPNIWLSENDSPGSTTAVLLGPVEETVIAEECAKHPAGVLWITLDACESPQKAPANLKHLKLTPDAGDFPGEVLQSFLGLNYEAIPSIRVSAAIDPTNAGYLKVLDMVMHQADTTLRARRTRSANGQLRQENVFRNLAGYLRGRLPESWRGLAQGNLAIVVGAGPSLDITLPFIIKGFGDPLIIAADSALGALSKHDISPDFVVNIDPEKSIVSCGSPKNFPGIAVLSSQSHPSWLSAWGEKSCYLSGRVLTEDWLASKGLEKTSLEATNNAGLTALLLADFLEASVVMLVGMDLAGSGDKNLRYAHSTGRSHQEVQAMHYHKVPGNHDDFVSTPFLSDYSETSANCPKVTSRRMVINFNDRGAQLEGTTVIHPDNAGELRAAVAENLKPFDRSGGRLQLRTTLDSSGINQLDALLAQRCDEIWAELNPLLATDGKLSALDKLQFFRALFSQHEIATLIGDYAFSVMPGILPGKEPTEIELDRWGHGLQRILWLLEEALLQTNPSEDFLGPFLTKGWD
ncbi:MAG: hypothetical protein CMI31_11570 [Opitutae bacterium]|nr:hypothetical protein [Opitutae bacterium]